MAKNTFHMRGDIGDTLVTGPMHEDYKEAELSFITFFDIDGNEVIPTGGTVKMQLSPDGITYRDVADGTMTASDLKTETIVMPYAQGLALRGKLVPDSIVGTPTITSWRAAIWRAV